MRLDDVIRQLEQGSRVPPVTARQQTLAWIRFFSEVERHELEAAPAKPDGQAGVA